MKHFIVGDLHLGKGLSIGKNRPGEVNSRTIDKTNILNWLLEEALKNGIHHLVLTGDIFEDSKPDYLLLKIFMEWLIKLESHEIFVDIVFGNHDMWRVGSTYFSVLDLIELYDFEYISIHREFSSQKIGESNFCFVPFRDRRSYKTDSNAEALDKLALDLNSLFQKDQSNVIVGHLTLEGALYVGDEIDDYHNELICPLSIFDKFDKTWMGHIHKPQILKKDKIEHVGSLDISDFGETDHQKIIILYDSETKAQSYIDVPTRPLRQIEIVVSEIDNPDEIVSEFIIAENKKKPLKDAIVKICIQLNNKEALNRKSIEKLIYDLGAFNICSFIERKKGTIISIQKKQVTNGTAEPKAAVTAYSNNNPKFVDLEFKKDFVEFCNAIIEEFKNK